MSKQIPTYHKSTKHNIAIEAVVTLLIIALLSILTYYAINLVQHRSRDTQRISDLNAAKHALISYYKFTRTLPKDSFEGLKKYPELFIKEISTDPLNRDSYKYYYKSDGQAFVLYAKMELDNKKAQSDGGVYNHKPLYYEVGYGNNWQKLIPKNLP